MKYYQRRNFTDDEIITARAMRKRDDDWNKLGRTFNCSPETIRRAIDPEFRARRAAQIANATRARDPYQSNPMRADSPTARPTEALLLARDARYSAPRTLTALFCGDPAPGQSALDKKRGVNA